MRQRAAYLWLRNMAILSAVFCCQNEPPVWYPRFCCDVKDTVEFRKGRLMGFVETMMAKACKRPFTYVDPNVLTNYHH